jgi:hypothetical protein
MNAPATPSDQAVLDAEPSGSMLDQGLFRRLALAKIKLDRLEVMSARRTRVLFPRHGSSLP